MPKYLIKAIFIPDNTKVMADRLVETDWLLVDPDKVNEINIFDKKYIHPLQCKDCAYYAPIVDEPHKSTCQRLWGGMAECTPDSYCSDGVRKEEAEEDG